MQGMKPRPITGKGNVSLFWAGECRLCMEEAGFDPQYLMIPSSSSELGVLNTFGYNSRNRKKNPSSTISSQLRFYGSLVYSKASGEFQGWGRAVQNSAYICSTLLLPSRRPWYSWSLGPCGR